MNVPVFLLAILLFFPSTLTAADRGVIGPIEPLDPTNSKQRTAPTYQTVAECYCITHRTSEPCVRNIRLLGLADEDCPPTPGLPCTHNKALHTDILASNDWARIGGYLLDLPLLTPLKSIIVGNGPDAPVEYLLTYVSGQAAGYFGLEAVATHLLPNHNFLTPLTTPKGDCESRTSCTLDYRLQVAYTNLREFQKPILISNVNGQPIYWVRCGDTNINLCPGNVDVPYNKPDHLRRHWGTKQTVDDLVTLSWRWYNQCSESFFDPTAGISVVTSPQDLVVSDMSLPFGGLFDLKANWQPLDKYQEKVLKQHHYSHRQGRDVDLSNKSVPTTGRCGERPNGGTWDPAWLDTELYNNDMTLDGLGFRTPNWEDPGHLKEVK